MVNVFRPTLMNFKKLTQTQTGILTT